MVRYLIIFLFLAPPKIWSQEKVEPILKIDFEHYVNHQPLTLDTVFYQNQLGQKFSLTKFRYYISNIELKSNRNKPYCTKNIYLIDEEDSTSKSITIIGIKQGNYDSISFLLGVDSLLNCSGAQSGALDPANGMFWTWNTGYIFLKLEGKSDASSATGKILEYHIGGYKEPTNCIERISLELKKSIQFDKDNIHKISIRVNIDELFNTPVAVDFSILPSVTDGKNAKLISTNYKDMFSIP